jgi:ribose transport system permease protein
MKVALPPWFSRFQSIVSLVLIIVIAVIFSPRTGAGSIIFLDPNNLTDVLRQQAEIGMTALAMTLVIISGGIDLSVGSMLAFSASLAAMLLMRWTYAGSPLLHVGVAIGGALAACTLVGLLNGAVIARLGIQPFIMTLATMIGVRGLSRWMTDNNNIDFGFGHDISAQFSAVFSNKLLVIGLWMTLAAIFYLLLEYTVFGRYTRAVGENEKAAGFTGLPIVRVKLAVYTLCGLVTGLAGVIHAARSHQGNPNDGVAFELDAIAAVVIGGTALSGGQGTITGTIVGTLIMGILTNLLRLRLIDSNLELMIKAVIIVTAVWLQAAKRQKN